MSRGKWILHKPSYNNPWSYNRLLNVRGKNNGVENPYVLFTGCSVGSTHLFWYYRHESLVILTATWVILSWTQDKGLDKWIGSYLIHNHGLCVSMCPYLTMKSNSDPASMSTPSRVEKAPSRTGANMCSRASTARLFLSPIAVRKACMEHWEVRTQHLHLQCPPDLHLYWKWAKSGNEKNNIFNVW